jgi:hypothetical protein
MKGADIKKIQNLGYHSRLCTFSNLSAGIGATIAIRI